MKLKKGFEDQKIKQAGLIVASLFNLQRYSKMSNKKLREECGGASAIKKDEELRTYVMSKEVKDILAYQANIKLLNKLEKEYGEKDTTSGLVGDIQRDFGITADAKNK